MAEPQRIRPLEARKRAQGGDALLICAYDSQEQCRANKLAGAITLADLKKRESGLAKDRELIFYCA